MKARTAVIISISQLLLLPLAALTSTAGSERTELQKCLDNVDLSAFKNSQWASCYEAELQRQDKNLNINYQKVQRTASTDTKEALIKAERAWLAYREAWCNYEELSPFAPGGAVNKLICLVETTTVQNDKLKSNILD